MLIFKYHKSKFTDLTFLTDVYPTKAEFAVGDQVVVISDPSVIYTIMSVYGPGYAICSFKDKSTRMKKELSIPLVAVAKYRHIDCDCV